MFFALIDPMLAICPVIAKHTKSTDNNTPIKKWKVKLLVFCTFFSKGKIIATQLKPPKNSKAQRNWL
ncbi:hypothetical protein CSC2_44460 [Clostridium zeae]|uniref:Secreted protein n=1 Tax=Clostridium zeae TaxID=2759022 RepID=A0ABQ1EGN4_9CLOT|nr:hypothetical protein CSC2_44460 [Clostridium zeae]